MPAIAGMTAMPPVIPAKAGIQNSLHPAAALDASLRWHDGNASRYSGEGWNPELVAPGGRPGCQPSLA